MGGFGARRKPAGFFPGGAKRPINVRNNLFGVGARAIRPGETPVDFAKGEILEVKLRLIACAAREAGGDIPIIGLTFDYNRYGVKR